MALGSRGDQGLSDSRGPHRPSRPADGRPRHLRTRKMGRRTGLGRGRTGLRTGLGRPEWGFGRASDGPRTGPICRGRCFGRPDGPDGRFRVSDGAGLGLGPASDGAQTPRTRRTANLGRPRTERRTDPPDLPDETAGGGPCSYAGQAKSLKFIEPGQAVQGALRALLGHRSACALERMVRSIDPARARHQRGPGGRATGSSKSSSSLEN